MKDQLAKARRLASVNAVLLALVVIAAVAALLLLRSAGEAQNSKTTIERQLAQAKQQLSTSKAQSNKSELEKELQSLGAPTATVTLPSRQEALNVVTALGQYATKSAMQFTTLYADDATSPGPGNWASAIRLDLEAVGTPEALIGILGFIDDYPISTMEAMEFSRDAEHPDQWTLALTFLITYGGETEGTTKATP